jgi:hypothetical protein
MPSAIPDIPSGIFWDAVHTFWHTRHSQAEQQLLRGTADQGQRSAVTGGAQMAGFALTIAELAKSLGIKGTDIYATRRLADLPGFYRPTKEWDLLIVVNDQLLAAIELKSQVGPSFGNNFNNRSEEAIGTAVDLWTAYREGALQTSPTPWLGYLFLLEDCPGSRTSIRVREPHFRVFEEFRSTSYAQRYELLCRRLILERQYTATCFLMSERDRAEENPNYTEPAEDLSSIRFLSLLVGHLAAALKTI